MEIEFKGHNIKGTPQEMNAFFSSAVHKKAVKKTRKYVFSGKYAKKKRYKITKEHRDNIGNGIKKSWKNRKKNRKKK